MKILFVLPTEPNIIFEEENLKNNIYSKIMLKFFKLRGRALTFPILAALTPKHYEIEVIEQIGSKIDFDKKYDLVGISCLTKDAFRAYHVADEFRKRGIPVIIGGFHPSALPEEAKQHADSVVIGEADETWPEIIKDFENGKLKPFYYPTRPVDPKNIPRPRTDIYPKDAQFAIHATRGCPGKCDFCAITHMKHRSVFRMRPIEDVVNEIKSQPWKTFYFYDDSLTLNTKYALKLFNEIKDLNKNFFAFSNIYTLGKYDELLKAAKEAGCVGWAIGFESVSQESLNSVGKSANKVEDYASTIKKIHDTGMFILGFFIFGFDHDHLDIFDKTDEFVRKNNIDVPRAYILVPYPGTPVYDRFEKEGRLLSKDWSKYQGHVVFQPKHMSPEELYTNTKRLYNKWYKKTNIFLRTFKGLKYGFEPMIVSLFNNFQYKYMVYPN